MSSPQASPAAVPASKSGKPLLLSAAALLLAGAGVVGYQKLGRAAPPAQPAVAPSEPGVVELEPFVLNLPDPAGDRYFRLRISLVLDRKEIAERASRGLVQVKLRDRILALLARQNPAGITSAEGKERLRGEVRTLVEQVLAEPPAYQKGDGQPGDGTPARVLEVCFTEFLLQ